LGVLALEVNAKRGAEKLEILFPAYCARALSKAMKHAFVTAG
jgi:hypothetical protein